jgi:hypothetical protein
MNLKVSKDCRYYMYENKVFDFVKNETKNIHDYSLPDLLDMLGNNYSLKTEKKEINYLDSINFLRKTAYNIFECFDIDTKQSLMMEYEIKFGSSLITESLDFNQNKLINESWNWLKKQAIILEYTINPLNSDFWSVKNFKDAGSAGKKAVGKVWDKSKELGGKAVDFVKEKAQQATSWLVSKGVPTIMEGIRAALMSWGGAIVSAILAVTPLSFLNWIGYGALLLYDILLAVSGQPDWGNIIVDIVGIIFGGGLGKSVFKIIGKVGGSLASVVQKLAKTAIGRTIVGGVKLIAKGVGKILKLAGEAVTWLANKFGIKKFNGIVPRIEGFISKIVNALSSSTAAAKQSITKLTQNVGKSTVGNVLKTKVGTGTVGTVAASAGIGAGLTLGLSNDKSMFGTSKVTKDNEALSAIKKLDNIQGEYDPSDV